MCGMIKTRETSELAKLKIHRAVAFMAVLHFFAVLPVQAQQVADFARADQVGDLQKQMEAVSSDLREHIATAQVSMASLGTGSKSDAALKANAYFDVIDQQAKAVMNVVSPNGAFMDALDDTRTKIISMIGRFEQDPETDARNARLAKLQKLKTEYEAIYDKIYKSNSQMSQLIVNNNILRGEVLKDIEVDEIAGVVEKLSKVSENLTQMADMLDQLSKAGMETPEQVAQVDNE